MNITEITSVRQQTAERLRLAPYCRVSSDSTDQLHSFAAQIRYYSDYAKKHPEYQLVDIYADLAQQSDALLIEPALVLNSNSQHNIYFFVRHPRRAPLQHLYPYIRKEAYRQR